MHGILQWSLNILDEDFTPNLAGNAYTELYQREWRSSALVAGSEAGVETRGFRGDYTVRLLQVPALHCTGINIICREILY